MPAPLDFPAEIVAAMKAAHDAGQSMAAIGAAHGVAKSTVQRLLADKPRVPVPNVITAPHRPADRSQDPLPAFHPITWSAISSHVRHVSETI